MDNEREKIIYKVVNKIVNDFTEKALLNVSPELIKKTIISEIKTMFLTLSGWFIGLLSAIFILNILYLSHSDSSIKNASLRVIGTLDGFIIIKNYLSLGITYILVFGFIAYISGKFESKSYEKNRIRIIELRNIVYILFIVSFCLKSFTVDQLDLVSLIISLVLLFKIVFKTDHTLSEKELKNIISEKVTENFNKEIEKESKLEKIVTKVNINNFDSKNDTFFSKFPMIIYFFYGFVLLFFGNKIEFFYDNITNLQKSGLFLIIVGFFSYSFGLTILEKGVPLTTRFINLLMSATLFIGATSIMSPELKVPFDLDRYYIQFVFFTIFIISVRVTSSLVIVVKKINKDITDPTQKLTILIGFFGIIISLLTILN